MNRWLAFLVVLNSPIAISVESSLAGMFRRSSTTKQGWDNSQRGSIPRSNRSEPRINILARRVARSHGRLARFHFGPSPLSITRQLPASS